MNNWLEQLHTGSAAFPPMVTAVKIAVALAIGLLIGFERQWSQKDFGVRTFSLTAMLGTLTAMLSIPAMLIGMIATLVLAVMLNVRDIVANRSVEGTTSAAMLVTYVLGALVGFGHMFTSVSCALVTTWLLSLKPQFKQFAGGVRAEEIRSAVMLGMFGFVVWPLLPNGSVDPWGLFQPRSAWITVVAVACIGFVNYVLLRIYGKQGVALSAVLGGLVNSTAAVAELSTSLPAAGLVSQLVPSVLLTTVAMFARNLALLALFARQAAGYAVLPLLAMSAVVAYFIFRYKQADTPSTELNLSSPVELKKVTSFALLFLGIQTFGTLAVRWLGDGGVLLVSAIGGLASSASTTAASANLAMQGSITPMQAATATVVASIASTIVNLPIVHREVGDKATERQLTVATVLQVSGGLAVLVAERWFLR